MKNLGPYQFNRSPSFAHSLVRAKFFVVITFFIIFYNSAFSVGFADEASVKKIKVGVLAYRGKNKSVERWQPTIDYLNSSLPQYEFALVTLNLEEMNIAVADKNIDFIITNTGNYVELEHSFGISRIATLINKRLNKATNVFGAVIFTRADNSTINTINDLKGKSFVAVNENGFGGFFMAWGEFKKHNIDPLSDFDKIGYAGFPQSKVMEAVLRGEYDAGTFRTDSLELLVAEGRLDLSQIKIINQKNFTNFPFISSTELYPEWPFSKLSSTSDTLARQVAIALLNVEESSQAAIAAISAGWTIPLDYKPANDLMKDLNVSPFNTINPITPRKIIDEYGHWILTYLVCFLLVSALTLHIYRLNLRLKKTNTLLKDEIIHRTQLANKLEYQAMHDALTNVYNRHAFTTFFSNELKRAKRNNKKFALMLIDVDNFKSLNDKYGHQVGDEYLQQLTQRIKAILRNNDVIARIGGDEFAIIYVDVNSIEDVNILTDRIINATNKPYEFADVSLITNISIGSAIYTIHGLDAETLFRCADNNMYQFKDAKKETSAISEYTPISEYTD